MLDLRCKKCNSKMLGYESKRGASIIDVWCRKVDCKAKMQFVVADGVVLTTIAYKSKKE